MGNQGYSHDATRVACEIFWTGEIGDVTEVHAWTGRPSWPQGMTKIPAPTRCRPRSTGTCGLAPPPRARSPRATRSTRPSSRRATTPAGRGPAARAGAAPPRGGARRGRSAPGPGARRRRSNDFGFYLPFNWRGFYDFGSSLIGDWGVHILGPANWGLVLQPRAPHQRGVHQEGLAAAVHVPGRIHDQVRVQGAPRHAAGHGLLVPGHGRRCLRCRTA